MHQYTLIEFSLRCVHFKDNHILSIQSNEVGGSYHMEKEGLHRVMEFLRGENLTVGVLVTDRHRQINKWLREMHPNVKHYYDVWHVAKGIAHIYRSHLVWPVTVFCYRQNILYLGTNYTSKACMYIHSTSNIFIIYRFPQEVTSFRKAEGL